MFHIYLKSQFCFNSNQSILELLLLVKSHNLIISDWASKNKE